jgi:hypothetical protein
MQGGEGKKRELCVSVGLRLYFKVTSTNIEVLGLI